MKWLARLWQRILEALRDKTLTEPWEDEVLHDPPVLQPDPPPKPTPHPLDPGDALDLSTVVGWTDPISMVQALMTAKVTATLRHAKISDSGEKLITVYDPYGPWPRKQSTGKPEIDASAFLFYRDGSGTIRGGRFDDWRTGGQAVKGLANVHDGYHGHFMPPRGADVWTMIASLDRKQRSNTCRVVWL